MTRTEPDVHGPVDFLLLEFPDDRLTGRAADELLSLVDRGIVSVYDVLIVGKDKTGTTYGVDFAGLPALGLVLGHAGLGHPVSTRIGIAANSLKKLDTRLRSRSG